MSRGATTESEPALAAGTTASDSTTQVLDRDSTAVIAPHGHTPVPAAPVPAAPAGKQTAKWGLPLVVLVVGMFMSVLDTSIINVAIPTMQTEFGVSTEDIQWVSNVYTLCLGVVVPTSAWLGDRLGLRRLYLISLIAFSASSVLCGLANGLDSMIVYRILQAIPGGIIPVTCLTMLYRMVPKEKIGTAMGMYGLGIVVAPAIGPTLGGYLVDNFSWRLIFFVNAPVGVIGALAAMVVLPRFAGSPSRKFDLPGFVCIAVGAFALLLAVSEGQQWGWTSYRVLILAALGINLLALFVAIELSTEQPLLDVRILTYWPFVNSLLLISALSIGLFAMLFFLPVFLQEGQNITAFNSGLLLLPESLVMAVLMPIAGRLFDKIGPRWLAAVGLSIAAYGTYLLSAINADMTHAEVIWWTCIRGLGNGMAMMPIMTAGLSVLPPRYTSFGSAFNTLVQRCSAAFGLAALNALATTQQAQLMASRSALISGAGANINPLILSMQQHGRGGLIPVWQQLKLQIQAQAYSNAFLIAGAFTLIGAILALFLRQRRMAAEAEFVVIEIG
ncbi:MAG: DHA2 family efflux MFS transporter permease subunit [Pseudonocardia sp.]|nr:DHA2 family efflux MFS transporter permease subunit [Pseudonocardia sp.]